MFDKYMILNIQSFLKECSNCKKLDLLHSNRYCYCCKKYFCIYCDMKWYYTLDEVLGQYCIKCYKLVNF